MYWIHFAIFILAVLVPQLVRGHFGIMREETAQSLLILFLGVIGFAIFLWKDREIVRHIGEKLRFQQQATTASRDLTASYSYIGELNRKFDLVKQFLFLLPEVATSRGTSRSKSYRPLFEALRLVTKADDCLIRYIDSETGKQLTEVRQGSCAGWKQLTTSILMADTRTMWEREGCIIVRSPSEASKVTAFLIFPKKLNRLEDPEILHILAAEALVLFGLAGSRGRKKRGKSDQPRLV